MKVGLEVKDRKKKKKKITVHSLKRKRNSRHFLPKLAGVSGPSSVEEGREAADRGKWELGGGRAQETEPPAERYQDRRGPKKWM